MLYSDSLHACRPNCPSTKHWSHKSFSRGKYNKRVSVALWLGPLREDGWIPSSMIWLAGVSGGGTRKGNSEDDQMLYMITSISLKNLSILFILSYFVQLDFS